MKRIVFLLLLVTGCGGLDSREDDLNKSLISYTEAIRWMKWKQAAGHVAPEMQAQWLSQRTAASRNLHMADVTLQGVKRKDQRDQTAEVYIAITWYRLPDTTLKNSMWKQIWRHDKNGWRITEEEPVEAAPEPVMMEPVPEWP